MSKPTSRGLHKYPIITSGGVFFIFYIIFLFFLSSEKLIDVYNYQTLLLFLIILTFGVYDDKKNLRRYLKLLAQSVLALIFIYIFNFQLSETFLPNIKIDFLYVILNIFILIGFINFINFIDGSDGNLTLFIIFVLICLISKFFIYSSIEFFDHLIYFLPFLFTFYLFNIQKKIFLGESGSLFFSTFLLLNFNYFALENLLNLKDLLIIFSYFIVDMIFTFVLRFYHYGLNSFKAHRDHAYQHFCYLKKKYKKLNFYMMIYNICYLFPFYQLYLHNYLSFLNALLFSLIPPVYFVIKYSPLIKK